MRPCSDVLDPVRERAARGRRLLLVVALVTAAGVASCVDNGGEPDTVRESPDPTVPPEPAEPGSPEPTEPGTPEPTEAERPAARPLEEISLTLTRVADARAPSAATRSPQGTLLIGERAGTVHPLTSEGLGPALLDLSEETTTDGERGLLGLAADDERLYVSFTDPNGDSRLDTFAWDGERVDPGRRETLLEQDQPFSNHNGGHVVLGPDGQLWFGLGDGGGAGDPLRAGQDRSSILGALLRLDPATGGPAPGNPFVDEADADPRIWAYGLRNPWRFSFDRATGDLVIADVGQDAREEVNWIPAGQGAGANLGWNLMEGTQPFAGAAPDDHWPPIYEYATNGEGCSITGGPVYRGAGVPGLDGAYLFSDFCAGGLRALRHDDGEVTEVRDFGVAGASSVVSFAEDADGAVYILSFGDGVLRIDPG